MPNDEQTFDYAVSHDEDLYEIMNNIKIVEHQISEPEILNATLSSKKIFDTFGIKPKSWHSDLKETILSLYAKKSGPQIHNRI